MHKLSSALAAYGLVILASSCGSTGKPDKDGIVRGPAPYGALVSGDEALKVIFDQVCLPTVLDGGDFVILAKSHYLIEGKPATDTTGQTSQTFILGSLAHASATLWSDGTCTIAVERGDTQAYSAHVMSALEARGQSLRPGVKDVAPSDGVRATYCNADLRPLLLTIVTPASPKSKRPAVVVNLYRAKGGASDICLRQ